ncbi:MAG: hypothetical protein KAR35_03305 [Candidatus Heimdallarchaeota archaeon]|nr:hypothetical protein [Candidatus Heimdallarchaeota archaeon]MCK5048382.1 hypothetical protein [Candidatus Heimdallarchaeota archaeon]
MEYKYTGNYYQIKSEEWLIEEEGVKLNFTDCKTAELVVEFSDYELTGWIIVGDIEVLADAISHTKKGAIGKVVKSSLTHCLIVDGTNPLAKQIDLGGVSPITEEQKASFEEILEKYDSKIHCHKKIKSDILDNTDWSLFMLSHKEVYIIAKETLVIVKGDDEEVFVRKSGDDGGAHVYVDKNSVNVHAGKCDIVVDKDGKNVIINGKNVKELVENTISKVKASLSFAF